MNTEPQHRIVLDFDDAESLQSALEYLGDSDAPVFLNDDTSTVTTGGQTYKLWDEFDPAIAALTES